MRRRLSSKALLELPRSCTGRATGFISAELAAKGSSPGASGLGGALGCAESPGQVCAGRGAGVDSCRGVGSGAAAAGIVIGGATAGGTAIAGFSRAGAVAAAVPDRVDAITAGFACGPSRFTTAGFGWGPNRSTTAVNSSKYSGVGRPCPGADSCGDGAAAGTTGLGTGRLLAAEFVTLLESVPPSPISPRAARSVPSTCFSTMGFWITKFSPARGPPRFALCAPTMAMVIDFLLAVAMRALCSTQPAPCSSSQSTSMASKCWSIRRLAAAKGSLQGSTAMSRSLSSRARVWTSSVSFDRSSDLKAMTELNLGRQYRPNK